MFEGLGLGARLAGLDLPKRLHWVPVAAAFLFSAITPVGLGVGLLVRKSYSPDSPVALIVSGILDSLSAGILLVCRIINLAEAYQLTLCDSQYTGLVELLCAEFLFHQDMREAPLSRVLYALGCVILGAIAMSVLGKGDYSRLAPLNLRLIVTTLCEQEFGPKHYPSLFNTFTLLGHCTICYHCTTFI